MGYRFWQLRQYSYIYDSLLALPYIKQRRRSLLDAVGNPFPLFKLAKLEAVRRQCPKRRDTRLYVLRQPIFDKLGQLPYIYRRKTVRLCWLLLRAAFQRPVFSFCNILKRAL